MNILELLTDIELKEIKIHNYKANQVVFNEGDICNYVGIILSGELKVITYTFLEKEETINIINENELYGQYLLFTNEKVYLGMGITLKNTKIAFIYKNTLLNILTTNKKFLEKYLELLGNETLKVKQQAKLLAHKNIRDRIIYYLTTKAINNKVEIKSITTLSNILSIPRPSLSRELHNMELDKLIIRKNKTIHLVKENYFDFK